MSGSEWQTSEDPVAMLGSLEDHRLATDRKMRLFACGWVREIWHLLRDERSRTAAEVAEQFADGMVTRWELVAARRVADDAAADAVYLPHLDGSAWLAAWDAVRSEVSDEPAARRRLAALLRCLIPNPFRRPPVIDPAWLRWQGGRVAALAQAIYDDRAFDRLPILADALEDAGCTDRAILDHCRGAGPHCRGCWVVDLLTGRV
jgi:hypothetical protein